METNDSQGDEMMKEFASKIMSVLRMMAALLVVATTMAISCPQPDPPEPPAPIEPTVQKSVELKAFESTSGEGLYIKGEFVVKYDDAHFQRAVNLDRGTYRIHADDQNSYMQIRYTENVPKAIDDEAVCAITYSITPGKETILIMKLTVVKISNGLLWLWNEIQKSGIIIPDIEIIE